MKNTLFTLSFILLGFAFCHSQTIEFEKGFGGYKFTQNGEKLDMEQLTMELNTNEESGQLIKKARNKNTIASILGGAGGALVGYPVGTAIGGGEPNWLLAGVGAGILAVAIPISLSANKNAKQAVEIYNSGRTVKDENLVFKPELLMVSNNSGIGLALRF